MLDFPHLVVPDIARVTCCVPLSSRSTQQARSDGSPTGHTDLPISPYFSWLETQSDDEMAAPREISPASTTPPMISASFSTLPLPAAAQQFQALALGGQPRAAAVGGDDERRDGDGDVHVPLGRQLQVDDASRRFGHVGHILPRGDEHGGDAIGRMGPLLLAPESTAPIWETP